MQPTGWRPGAPAQHRFRFSYYPPRLVYAARLVYYDAVQRRAFYTTCGHHHFLTRQANACAARLVRKATREGWLPADFECASFVGTKLCTLPAWHEGQHKHVPEPR